MLRLLLLDNYDSFTYNLRDYLLQQPPVAQVQVWRNDRCTVAQIAAQQFDGIVLSPGPKRPADAGILMEVLRCFCDKIPILGVCLGHQAMGELFGARLVHAAVPMHGKTDRIEHSGTGLFVGLPNPLQVMRYHSLVLEQVPAEQFDITASSSTGECMAICHKRLPICGVQFHPESILTPQGLQLLNNWCKMLK